MSSQGSTRLSQMQQRFQQKQVHELTVQKKADIFNNFDLNEPKVLASSLGAGKVRQMFDRHRGIDKSYLLQPIQHASAPAAMVKKPAPTKPIRETKISGYNSKIIVPPLAANRSNVHQDVNGNNKFASEIRSPLTAKSFSEPRKSIPLVSKPKSLTSSQSSSGKSVSNGNQIKSPTRSSMNSGNTTPGSSGSTRTFTKTTQAVIERSSPSPVFDDQPVPEGLVKCQHCTRNFAEDRIEKHQVICLKSKTKKRRIYDGSKARVEGTEAATFVLKQTKTGVKKVQAPAPVKKENNWRTKHEEFIAAIRAAKEIKVFLAKGGKLSDLPPPPPSLNPDYVQCPHCTRRFNQGAADRHIPKCATMMHNKPAKKQVTPARKR